MLKRLREYKNKKELAFLICCLGWDAIVLFFFLTQFSPLTLWLFPICLLPGLFATPCLWRTENFRLFPILTVANASLLTWLIMLFI